MEDSFVQEMCEDYKRWVQRWCVMYHPVHACWYLFSSSDDDWWLQTRGEERHALTYATCDAAQAFCLARYLERKKYYRPHVYQELARVLGELVDVYDLPRPFVLLFDVDAERMKHEPACEDAREEHARLLQDYEARYPTYCRACFGLGYTQEQDYEGEWEQVTCAQCFDQGYCPRCHGRTLFHDEKLSPFSEDDNACHACHWFFDEDGDAFWIPAPFVCQCAHLAHV